MQPRPRLPPHIQPFYNAFYFMSHPQGFVGKGAQNALMQVITRELDNAQTEMEIYMAKKNGTKAVVTDYTATKWINRNLTTEEKREHDERKSTPQNIALRAVELALHGYTLKVSFDAYSKCFQATLLVWQAENPNFGYGLSARGSDPLRAVSLLLYKHFEILKENWAASYSAPVDDFEG